MGSGGRDRCLGVIVTDQKQEIADRQMWCQSLNLDVAVHVISKNTPVLGPSSVDSSLS